MNITNIVYGIALFFIGLLLIWKAPGEGKLLGLGFCGTGALMLISATSAAFNKDESNKNPKKS